MVEHNQLLSSPLPNLHYAYFRAVLGKRRVMCEEQHTLGFGLCDEHAVEWICVYRRQGFQRDDMPLTDWYTFITSLFAKMKEFNTGNRDEVWLERFFDRDLPHRSDTDENPVTVIEYQCTSGGGQFPVIGQGPERDMGIQQYIQGVAPVNKAAISTSSS